MNGGGWQPNDITETYEQKASDLGYQVIDRLRAICADPEANLKRVLRAVEDYTEELSQGQRERCVNEQDAIGRRWDTIERMVEEGTSEAVHNVGAWKMPHLFARFGPADERHCDWRRTMAEPWASLSEVLQ